MRAKHFFDGPISVMLLVSVPALALLTLSPWGSPSQAGIDPVLGAVSGNDPVIAQATTPGANAAHDQAIVDLSDWNYTGRSMKSMKSKKIRKSPMHPDHPDHPDHPENPNHPDHPDHPDHP